MTRPLVLASSSTYRAELLARLRLAFDTARPDVDERPLAHESAAQLCQRLAEAKARALRQRFPAHWLIGSDQVADCQGQLLGKPLDHAAAVAQLTTCSGQRVDFYTGLSLYDSATDQARTGLSVYSVFFRTLDAATIERYLLAETPYDCAGSFRCEGLGVALFERMQGDDPTSLVGLPLILLSRWLNEGGVRVP